MNKKFVKKQKESKNSLAKGLIFIGIYVLFSFVLEVINFNVLGFGFLPSNILFNLAFWLVVAGILFLIPSNVAQIIVGAVLLAIQVFINLVNATLVKNTGLVFHWYQLAQTGDAATSLESDMVNFGLIFAYILIFAAFLLVTILLHKKLRKGFDFAFTKRLAFWLSCSIAFIAVGSSFVFLGNHVRNSVNKKAYAFTEDNGKSLADGVYLRNATFRVMGTFGYYFHDLVSVIESSKKDSESDKKEMKETLEEGLKDYKENPYDKSSVNDNLIYILLESFDLFSIDPYNTPNLYKLAFGGDSTEASKNMRWGTYFDSFYGLNYTNDSEYISLTGHTTEKMPLIDYYKKKGIMMPYSLPNLFIGKGYQEVNYFHSYNKDYYNRDELYKAIGFKNVYGLEDSDMKNKSTEFGDWVLDSEYVESMIETIIPEGKSFFSYYTTISTHGPYDGKNERLYAYETNYDKNLDNFKKYLESKGYVYPSDSKSQKALKAYKTAVMDTDKMIGLMFDRLAKLEILDSTTIILFSDHNCFYNDLKEKICGTETRYYEDVQANNIPLIIYNNDSFGARKVTTVCNTYDLYSTICHMFGFKYNTLLTQGYSIMQPKEIAKSIHVSFKHGIFNEEYYTDDLIHIKELSREPVMSKDDFKKYAYEFFKKQEIIEFVYRNNLYVN